MNGRTINSTELADLSAYLDGELPAERKAEIERLLERDDALAAALRELRAVDGALDLLEVAPLAGDLADRIVAAAESARRGWIVAFAKYLAPLAAAAVLVAALLLYRGPGGAAPAPAPTAPGQTAAADHKAVEEFARDHLDFFQDYEVLANYETLEAMDALEGQGSGT